MFGSGRTITNFQKAVIKESSARLGRSLTEKERLFITSRGSFIALEMIMDTVKSSEKDYLERYLNS